jgi:filamentous hemagglutinin family protein
MCIRFNHGKASRKKTASLMMVMLWVWGLLASSPAFAAPQGGVVTSGSATINQAGNVTNINQSTNAAAINWQSFSVKPVETVNFNQPSASSLTLNRVIGNEKSIIEGAINATGKVFLLNSNGILFTKDSSVNTAGFIASTLNITDEDFNAGNYVFKANGSTGSVINLGTITARDGGYVALLGNSVSNQGIITATKGTVAMASGDKVTLNFNGDSLLSVTVDEGALNALVENKEAIYADGGRVIMTAKAANDLLTAQVNNTGIIRARTIDDLKGNIKLYADSGTVTVDGTLDASAPTSGDGGMIETSGNKVKVNDTAVITTKSAYGTSGTWTIDPDGFIIGTIAGVDGDMTGAALTTALTNGNVTIASTSGSGSDGNIDVNGAVSWAANTLILNATRNIYVNAAMTATGTAGFAANYGHLLDANGNPTATPTPKATATSDNADGTPYGLYTGQNYNVGFLGAVNFSGTGSVMLNGTPYTVINDVAGLTAVNSDLAGNYVLGSNLTASSWTGPIAGSAAFTGNFNGLGHRIYKPKLTATGLFGTIGTGALVSNLYVYATVDAAASDADTVPAAGILANYNQGSIINSVANGTLNNSNITSAGGLVGINSGLIAQAYAYNTVYAINTAGGLVGTNTGGGTIIDSAAGSGKYVANTSGAIGITYVGGLVGVNEYGGTISRSYADNTIQMSDTDSTAGAFVGKNAGSIDQCYVAVGSSYDVGPNLAGFVWENTSTGTITDAYASGLDSTNASANWIAGFAYKNAGAIENAYAISYSANTTAASRYGFAYENTGTIRNAYWYANTATDATTGAATGTVPVDTSPAKKLDATQVTIFSNYAGFDTDIWGAFTSSYPVLRNITVYVNTLSSATPVYGDTMHLWTRTLGVPAINMPAINSDSIFTVKTASGYLDAGTWSAPDVLASSVYKSIKGTVTVKPRQLTVSGVVADKTYDGTTDASINANVANNGLVGLLGNETLNITYTAAAFADKNAGTGKTATVTYAGLSDGTNGGKTINYTIKNTTTDAVTGMTTTTTTANIAKREVSGILTVEDKVYDGTTDANVLSGVLAGVLLGDELSLSYDTAAAFADKNAGTGKVVTVTGLTLDGADSANYTINSTALAAGTILPLALVLAGSKSYDGNATVSASDICANNLIIGDTATLSGTARIASSAAGIQSIVDVSGLTVNNPNYTLIGSVGEVVVGSQSLALDKVVSGTATINTADNTTTITTSDRAIIDWLRFSIAANETVNFVQPASTSIVLNRVTGIDPTVIAGTLNANGRVFIINSNGVLFAAGSRVDVAGLIASALNTSNDNFLNSNYVFTAANGNGLVINKGDIFIVDDGFLALASNHGVTDTGTITAHGGDVLFASADKLTLTLNTADVGLDNYIIRGPDGTTTVSGPVDVAGDNGGLFEMAGNAVTLGDGFALVTGANGTWSWSLPAITIGNGGTFTSDYVQTQLGLRNFALNAFGGDLTVNDAINWSSDSTLTLSASNDININKSITATGTNAGFAMNYGHDYNILTPASFSGAVIDPVTGYPVAQEDTSGGVYGSITLLGSNASLVINGNAYILIHSMSELDLLDKGNSTTGMYYNPQTGAYDTPMSQSATIGNYISSSSSDYYYNPATGAYDIPKTRVIDDTTYYYNLDTGSYDLTTAYSGKVSKYYYNPATGTYNIPSYDTASGKYYDLSTGTYELTARYGGREYYYDVATGKYDKTDYDTASAKWYSPVTRDYTSSSSLRSTTFYFNPTTGYYDITSRYAITGYYAITEDIDAAGISYTNSPIGTLSGTLTGLGHTVNNLTISSSEHYIGLIGEATSGSVIRDIGVVNANVTTPEQNHANGAWTGALVGQITGGTVSHAYSTGIVSNAGLIGYASNSVISDSFSDADIPGGGAGLIGISDYSTVVRSHATGDVSNGGGLIGTSYGTDIANCYATGNVGSESAMSLGQGGLVGQYSNANDHSVVNSFATGNVTGIGPLGGLLGTTGGTLTIDNTYAAGNVTATGGIYDTSIGGLIGKGSGTITNSHATGNVTAAGDAIKDLADGWLFRAVGGLIGAGGGTITNCYATGDVYAPDVMGVGALIGMGSGTLTNVYATGNVTGGSRVGGLIGWGDAAIYDSYASGTVTVGQGSDWVHVTGALVGFGTITEMENTYWNGDYNAVGYGSVTSSDTKSQGLTKGQFNDLQYYKNGTIDQVFTDRAAYAAFKADASNEAGQTTGQTLQDQGDQSGSVLGSSVTGGGPGEYGPTSLDGHITYADSGSYSAHIKAITTEGTTLELEDDSKDENK